MRHLPALGCQAFQSADPKALVQADVMWDPRAGGGHPPAALLYDLSTPLVVTLHGVAPLEIPFEYIRGSTIRRAVEYVRLKLDNHEKVKSWRVLPSNLFKVVTVSHFAKQSIMRCLGLNECWLEVIHNGVDLSAFGPDIATHPEFAHLGPYFLHISNDEPRKNVDRIVAAYQQLESPKWPLLLRLGGSRAFSGDGVIQIRERVANELLPGLYRGAGAFVFPSLYEGFGLPVLEAFACGCQVITARESACDEVAGGLALLVDPRDTVDLRRAMECAMSEYPGYVTERTRRADAFGWPIAAEAYARVFRDAVRTRSAAGLPQSIRR